MQNWSFSYPLFKSDMITFWLQTRDIYDSTFIKNKIM